MKKIYFLISILLITTVGFSQTGPGGIGTANGSGNLIFWVKADQGVETTPGTPATDGNQVSTWVDQSGSGNDATSPSTGAIFTSSIFNSLPVLRFSNNDIERLMANFTRGNNENLFLVGSNKDNTNNTFVDDGDLSGTNNRRIFTDIGQFNNPTCALTYPTFVSNPTTSITNNAPFLANFEISSTGNEQYWINGNLNSSGNSNPPAGTSLIIGNNSTLGSKLNGDIAEIIVFNTTINSVQRIIVNNYLAAKYDFTLSSNNLYNQAGAANGNYDFEVAGIGRINASNIHNDAQGSGIVRILNPTGLDNNEFLFWGHDNDVQEATETTDIPLPVQGRFKRVWRVSEVNTSSSSIDVGNIDIRFDVSGLGSVTASDLRLLVDTDNDGLFADETPLSGATSIGGNVYQFSGVSAIADNLRFTLGTINKIKTPLPIELLNFNTHVTNNNYIKIDWQTAAEINNDFFSIERSKDGAKWENIKNIKGAGNSHSLLNYLSFDKSPYSGISYYRLKQTDFNGKYSYSNIISINVQDLTNNKIEIYPNPTTNKVSVKGSKAELEQIQLFNSLGRKVTISITRKEDTEATIDLSNLKNGMYYIKTKTTTNKVFKQ